MKIGNTLEHPAVAATGVGSAAANQPAGTVATPVATPAAGADASAKVELSSAASLMNASGGAEFDAEKVARISQAIADGSFKIHPEVIADKLIANAQELLSKGSR